MFIEMRWPKGGKIIFALHRSKLVAHTQPDISQHNRLISTLNEQTDRFKNNEDK